MNFHEPLLKHSDDKGMCAAAQRITIVCDVLLVIRRSKLGICKFYELSAVLILE